MRSSRAGEVGTAQPIDYGCLLKQCGGELGRALADPEGVHELACLLHCDKNDLACQVRGINPGGTCRLRGVDSFMPCPFYMVVQMRCGDLYERDVLRDFHTCAISTHQYASCPLPPSPHPSCPTTHHRLYKNPRSYTFCVRKIRCVPQRVEPGPVSVPPPSALVTSLNLQDLSGKWWVIRGFLKAMSSQTLTAVCAVVEVMHRSLLTRRNHN